jgi:hypothetical protein
LVIAVLGALLMAARVKAQDAASARRAAIVLSVERCEGLPFDVEAYERVLAIEVQVLEGLPADAGRERLLSVRSPGCSGELEVSLRMGERSSAELLRASDYAGIGQPRALALATIETLRVLTARLQAVAEPAEPSAAPAEQAPLPAEPPAASKPGQSTEQPEPPEPVRRAGSFELYAGIGAGLFDTLDWQVELGGALALTRAWWIETALAYGQASDEGTLGSVDASALTLAVSLETRLQLAGPFELSFGAGLRGGAAWASADSALPLREGADVQVALAPVLLAFAELGVAYEVTDGLVIGVLLEPGLGIEVAQFLGPPPAAFDTEDAVGQRQPEVSVLGHGVYGGLTLGYRF